MSFPNKGQSLNWFTPVSKCEYLHFEKMVDDLDTLSITVRRYITLEQSELYCFKWKEFVAYRNTLEEHRLPWDLGTSPDMSSGPTRIVANSSWIADLRFNNDYMDMNAPNANHYVIGTDSYWTEVISSIEPEIIKLE